MVQRGEVRADQRGRGRINVAFFEFDERQTQLRGKNPGDDDIVREAAFHDEFSEAALGIGGLLGQRLFKLLRREDARFHQDFTHPFLMTFGVESGEP